MTPTASSSPISLLTPATPAATGTPGAEAQATPDAGLGGFGLLLGALQQLQQELGAAIAEGTSDGEPTSGSGDSSGNALPPLGMLLPLSGKASGAAGDMLPAEKSGEGEKTEHSDDADAGAELMLFNAMQAAPVAVNSPAANSNSPSAAVNSQSGDSSVNVIGEISAGKLMSQIAASTAGSAKDNGNNGNGKSDRNTALSLKLGTIEPARTSDTVSADGIDTAALAQDAPDISPAVDSDFESFVKHFDAGSSPPTTGTPANVGESAAINHASRTYSAAANSNATVPVPVGAQGWSDAIADKVMWFSANNVTSAEIHLNPPDLGPLQVRVSTQQDQASVVFTSQHATVRDALDQALPRLRDMMGSQGMQLLDVSVGSQTPQQQQQQFTRNDSPQSGAQFAGIIGGDAADPAAANVTTINTARLLRSGFDAYA